jgi:uncharacterized peroxidase-related enzyme
MPLIEYVQLDESEDRVRELLEQSADRHGKTSLLLAILAHSPAVLDGWHSFYGAVMLDGSLTEDIKQLTHVTVSITNGCEYCAASHTENLVEDFGIPQHQVKGIADTDLAEFTPRQRAAVEFAAAVATDPKRVTEDDVQSLYDVGFDDEQVVELLATVALANAANTVTDSMNVFPMDRDDLLAGYSPE